MKSDDMLTNDSELSKAKQLDSQKEYSLDHYKIIGTKDSQAYLMNAIMGTLLEDPDDWEHDR